MTIDRFPALFAIRQAAETRCRSRALSLTFAAWLLTLLAGVSGVLAQDSPPRSLSLAEALEKAAAGHPAIQAAAPLEAAAKAQLQQAQLRPNPRLNFQSENWRLNGAPEFQPGEELDTFLYLAQPLETGGKRARRIEEAGKEISLARAEMELLRWRIRQEVRLGYQQALLNQEQYRMLQEVGGDLLQIVDYHRIRVEQGAMAEADLIKVSLERERHLLTETAAAGEAEISLLELLRAMGEKSPYPQYPLVENPEPGPRQAMNEAELRRRAAEQRPDLRLARLQLERTQAVLETQKTLARPDLELIMGYKRTGGYDTLLAGLSLPLPLFNRNEGRIAQSRAEIDRAAMLLQAARVQAEAQVSSAAAAVRRKQAMVRQMDTSVVERARESWRISLAAYQEGGTDLLRLLDAQRVLRDVQLLQARLKMEYRLSLIELESAVGDENVALVEEVSREKR